MYPNSPTPSYFKSINIITKNEFEKQYIKEDFSSKENEEKRNWYFTTFSKQQNTAFREKWYNCMILKKINIPFLYGLKLIQFHITLVFHLEKLIQAHH